jgi:hypothetical protein
VWANVDDRTGRDGVGEEELEGGSRCSGNSCLRDAREHCRPFGRPARYRAKILMEGEPLERERERLYYWEGGREGGREEERERERLY